MATKNEITLLLEDLKDGRGEAMDDLLGVVYAELRQLAGSLLRRERAGHTLAATDIVHEAFFRLFDSDKLAFEDRRHFYGCASRAMRRVLVDHARKKMADKRIPAAAMASIDDATEPFDMEMSEILALDEALENLEALDPRQLKIVEMRYFGGLTETEVAELLDLSRATVSREWRAARVWLRSQVSA